MPEVIDGNTLTATVVDLNAWVEYEFRVLAKNGVGVGEPSPVSVRTRTEDAGPAWLTSSILITNEESSFCFQMLLAFLAFFFHEQSISFCTLQKYTLKPQKKYRKISLPLHLASSEISGSFIRNGRPASIKN